MKTIAIIGTGIMGTGIAMNFVKKGYLVLVWNRTKEKLQPLVNMGAVEAATPKEAAEKADIIFEVTATEESSRSVWTGENGILSGAQKGKILIASGTLSLEWVDELAQTCAQHGFAFFDMPLTGTRQAAEGGTLWLLVGGDEALLKEIEPDLEAISEQRFYFGKAGSGMRYKLILNSLAAIHVGAFVEMLTLAKSLGLDVEKVGEALCARPGGVLTQLAWKNFHVPPDPINFATEWILKDVTYAELSAKEVPTPFLHLIREQYKKLVDEGNGSGDWTVAVNPLKEK